MKKLIGIALAVAFTAVLTVGCKRDDPTPPPPSPTPIPDPRPTPDPKPKECVYDVYVAGHIDNKATLWVNGVPSTLPLEGPLSYASSVVVSGKDVYVAGIEKYDNRWNIVLWENGTLTAINRSREGRAGSLFVSGNDIYIAGQESSGANVVPMLWTKRRGANTWNFKKLSDASTYVSAYSVYVLNNTIYVAGVEKGFAMLWTKQAGSDTWSKRKQIEEPGVARFISGLGDAVYVVGFEKQRERRFALLWRIRRDGSVMYREWINGKTEPSIACSAFAESNACYVVGYAERGGKDVAMLWYMGLSTALSDPSLDATAYSVFVIDKRIYVAGYEKDRNTGKKVAMLWTKEGPAAWKAQRLSDGSSEAGANSVYVVKQEKK